MSGHEVYIDLATLYFVIPALYNPENFIIYIFA